MVTTYLSLHSISIVQFIFLYFQINFHKVGIVPRQKQKRCQFYVDSIKVQHQSLKEAHVGLNFNLSRRDSDISRLEVRVIGVACRSKLSRNVPIEYTIQIQLKAAASSIYSLLKVRKYYNNLHIIFFSSNFYIHTINIKFFGGSKFQSS